MSHHTSVLFYLFLLLPLNVFAQGEDYTKGLKLFQEGKYEEACPLFQKSLEQNPGNPTINYNLGLCESKLSHLGPALGYLRRALTEDPFFDEARWAISQTTERLKIKALPHQITTWESFRELFLSRAPIWVFLAFTAAFLFFAGWNLINYFVKRKAALANKTNLPALPWLSALSTILFLLSLAAVICKIIDSSTTRATMVAAKTDARTGPGEDQTSLFELTEGLEVVVQKSVLLDSNARWAQVTYPGGMSGWIPAETLMFTSGKTQW